MGGPRGALRPGFCAAVRPALHVGVLGPLVEYEVFQCFDLAVDFGALMFVRGVLDGEFVQALLGAEVGKV